MYNLLLFHTYLRLMSSFLAADDGNIYEGRGWQIKPSRQPNFHEIHGKCYSIGLIGKKGI